MKNLEVTCKTCVHEKCGHQDFPCRTCSSSYSHWTPRERLTLQETEAAARELRARRVAIEEKNKEIEQLEARVNRQSRSIGAYQEDIQKMFTRIHDLELQLQRKELELKDDLKSDRQAEIAGMQDKVDCMIRTVSSIYTDVKQMKYKLEKFDV